MIVPVIVDTVLFTIGLIAVLAGLLVFASASRTSDFALFESRSAIARRLIATAFIPLALELLGTGSVIGVALVVLAVLWAVSWIPARRRRFEYGAQTVFRSPPEAVAAVMFDVSAQPKWMESVREAVLETPGFLRVGSVIRQRVEIQGRQLVAHVRVTELDPYHKVTLALETASTPAIDVLEVTPQGAGSRVRFGGSQQLPTIIAILGAWRLGSLRRRFETQRAVSLERLRTLVEPYPARRAV
jgi:polyketide cyclase/dehydrase/lipid transport protein